MIPLQKVKDIIFKHNMLEKELASGNIDPKQFAKKSKEYSSIGNIILIAKEYVNFENTKKDDPKSVEYNEYIRFNTYEFAILGMLEKEDHFSIFKNVIEKYFVENYDKIIEKLKSYQHLDGKVMKTFIWGHSVKINYKDLIIKFNKLYDKLSKKDFSLVENTSVILK